MPQGDRTGPMGQGSGTGRALGLCSGYESPGCMRGFGQGEGRRRPLGRRKSSNYGKGRRKDRGRIFGKAFHSFNRGDSLNPEEEIRLLKAETEQLHSLVEDFRKKFDEIQNGLKR